MTLTGEYEPSQWEWVRNQVAEYEASDGARANTLGESDDPIVVITSVGASSDKLRKNPVMRVEKDGKYVAVASKGGAPEHPSWYHNFVAHPEVDLQDGADKRTYRARLVTGEERAEWWDHAVATWPTYAEYQEKTDREIPVFLLEPIE
ncbi:nitroreductase family deazaflavin-dependent oxidoreductase [Nocardioides panacisoli]|uniref:nitroreductase family deazaflavin-dependent oxidoreductase n=1 Tax=Nocardioides panacisoli TaxID=627624 RepID=UPI001C632449|nr:nitroreductase family deazaflavin-dependent oxidoreductase [Nocardioides panacisoli]QYJ03041.1 nitroreductase family deazaflavin-dependent oxidoreductase [Nocardioides panacisoli]